MEELKDEIKDCPFCGQPAMLWEDTGGWSVGCMNINEGNMRDVGIENPTIEKDYCGIEAVAYGYKDKETPIRIWNTRSTDARLAVAVKALHDVVETHWAEGDNRAAIRRAETALAKIGETK